MTQTASAETANMLRRLQQEDGGPSRAAEIAAQKPPGVDP